MIMRQRRAAIGPRRGGHFKKLQVMPNFFIAPNTGAAHQHQLIQIINVHFSKIWRDFTQLKNRAVEAFV